MAVGVIGALGRLGLKATGALVKGAKAAPGAIIRAPGQASSALLEGSKSAGGAALRASVNIPANLLKAGINGHLNDLGLHGLQIRTGNILNKKDPNVDPATGRPRPPTPTPRVRNTRPESNGLGRNAAAAIVRALAPLNDIAKTLDGIDGSMAGIRSDNNGMRGELQRGLSNIYLTLKAKTSGGVEGGGDTAQQLAGIRSDNLAMRGEVQRGFQNVLVALKLLKPNPFNELRAQRGHHNDLHKNVIGGSGKGGSSGIGGLLGGILGGLAGMLGKLFGPASALMTGLGLISRLSRGAARGLMAIARGIGRTATAMGRSGARMAARTTRGLGTAGRNAETGIGRRAARAAARATGATAAAEAVTPHTATTEPHPTRGTTGEPGRPGGAPEAEPHARGTTAEPGTPRTAAEIEAEKARINRPLHDAPRPGETDVVPPRPSAAETPTPHAPANTVAKAVAATETPATGTPDPAKPTTTPEPAPKAEPKAEPKTKIPKTDRALTKQLSKVLGKSMLVLGLAVEAWDAYDQWADAYDKYSAGEMSPKDYRKETVRIVGGAAGSVGGGAFLGLLGGVAAGAIAGPAAPITSTILGITGGIAGGVVGSMAGKELGNKAGNMAADMIIGQTDDQDKMLKPGDEGYRGRAVQPQSPAIPPSNQGIQAPTTAAPQGTGTAATTAAPSVRAMEVQTPQATQAQQMVTQSQTNSNRDRQGNAPVIIAPNTTNNTTNNSGGGSGGSTRPAVGSPSPNLNPLDNDLMGRNISTAPGSF